MLVARMAGRVLLASLFCLVTLAGPMIAESKAETTGWRTVANTYTRATVSYTVGTNNVKTVTYIGVSGRRKWINPGNTSYGCVTNGWGVPSLRLMNNGTTYQSWGGSSSPGYVDSDCGTYRTRFQVSPNFTGTNPSVYASTIQYCGGSCTTFTTGVTITF